MKRYIFVLLTALLTVFSVFSEEEKIIISGNNIYSINRSRGFEISAKDNIRFSEMNSNLPVKIVYPFEGDEIRSFSSVNNNPENTGSFSLTTPSQLFISKNIGNSWQEISIKYPFKKSYYITSSAVKGSDSDTLLLGTSFSGLFESKDNGRSWKSYRKNSAGWKKVQDFMMISAQ